MIAFARPHPELARQPAWHDPFLSMVPTIRHCARYAFRRTNEEAREDLILEAVANAMVAFIALYQRGRADLAYPTVLARYAVAQVRSGRRVGCRMNSSDLFAKRAQLRAGIKLKRLSELAPEGEDWIEATIEDSRTSVPDQAAFRCDFPRWLDNQEIRSRRIAKALAIGNSTQDVAKEFGLSPGRISQLRTELYQSWQRFHGEHVAPVHRRRSRPRHEHRTVGPA